ncbi:MAG TPA: Rossmann-like and DUF2520 domain-containing protein [Candidatus Edwardsbacteria bacterium]|nr:Rossmann-like and DUF2520 domain-containing protein [Candidatus Edwardsbacteria bacterium]
MAKPVISLIGAGRLGTSLAAALAEKGYPVHGVADRDLKLAQQAARDLKAAVAQDDPAAVCAGAGLVIVAVPDGQIKPLSERLAASGALRKGQIICHTSGFLPASVLVAVKMHGVYTISMHPLMSFTRRMEGSQAFRGIHFALEGDAVALEAARELVAALDGFAVVIKPQDKPLYHAAAVLSSNYLVTLISESVELLRRAGIAEEDAKQMLLPMAAAIIGHLRDGELGQALTGPIERGDELTVAGHLQALRQAGPEALAIYTALGKATLRLVRDKLAAGQAQALERTLGG